jgi:hypothetical protein
LVKFVDLLTSAYCIVIHNLFNVSHLLKDYLKFCRSNYKLADCGKSELYPEIFPKDCGKSELYFETFLKDCGKSELYFETLPKIVEV